MPYEYGYELSSCDNCGSSLHQYGERCSNCGGIYRPPDPKELERQAEIGRLFAERQREAALKREEVASNNNTALALGNKFAERPLSIVETTRIVDRDVFERISKLSSNIENAVQAKFQELHKWQHYRFSEQQKQEIIDLLRRLYVFEEMQYNDARSSILHSLKSKAQASFQRLTGKSYKPGSLLTNALKKINRTQQTQPPAERTNNEQQKAESISSRVRQTVPNSYKHQELPSGQQPLYLYVVGKRHVVEAAVKNAQQWQLTPRYMSFSSSNPNALWKARVETTTVTPGLFRQLTEAGWRSAG